MRALKQFPPAAAPRKRGAPSRRAADPLPTVFPPMLATLAPALPVRQSLYGFEYKWDGVRAICRWDGKNLSMWSRNQLDITRRYPELWDIGKVFGSRTVILDGEVIALDDEQRPSFTQLQNRMHVNDEHAIKRLIKQIPAFFMAFDVLYLDGKSLMNEPWLARRDKLDQLQLESDGSPWRVPPAHVGEGDAMLDAARQMKLEGLVAKHVESTYRPGARSADWLKVKIVGDEEFVVGGWFPEAGTRTNRVGSLLIGQYDDSGQLRFAGGIGTGFTDKVHKELTGRLHALASTASPFADPIPKRGALFVKPQMVVQVEYRRRTPEGMVHQGAYKGLRDDKEPREVKLAG
jgi:bifunctional non-homologous end joining protein LigD